MSRGFIKVKTTSLVHLVDVAVMAASKQDMIGTFNKNRAQLCHHGYFCLIREQKTLLFQKQNNAG